MIDQGKLKSERLASIWAVFAVAANLPFQMDATGVSRPFSREIALPVAISEGFDMTNPYGRAMAQMASVFAELE